MTREELIELVNTTDFCPGKEHCIFDMDCRTCAERQVEKYENEIRNEAYKKLLAEVDDYEFYLPGRNRGRSCTQMLKGTIEFLISMVEEQNK